PNTNKHIFEADKNAFKIDGDTVYTPSSTSFSGDKTMVVFASRDSNGVTTRSKEKIYFFKIYNNGTLVLDLIPAKNSSGVVGMYDTVSGAFFTNAGTGTFTAGPVVLDSCRNLFDPNTVDVGHYYDASLGYANSGLAALSGFIPVTAGQSYTLSGTNSYGNSWNIRINTFNTNQQIQSQLVQNVPLGSWTYTLTIPAGISYIRYSFYKDDVNIQQIEEGDTATAYVPYNASCHNPNAIKIATTAYNAARFSPVVTDLNSAVATIREIVTKTINQTAAIASLQADKQTRPEDACPAGKKCLLVETEENGVIVPHWFPIIENIYGLPTGYTPLEYIQSTGTQYIDTGIKASLNTKAEGVFEIPSDDVGQLFGSYDEGAYFRFYVPASSLKTKVFDGVGLQTSLVPEDVSRGTKIKITLDKTGLYVGNKTFAYDTTPSAFTATSNIYIGMISSYTGTNVSKGKVYSFKLYDNDTLVRDFVPAKNSSGVIGMYDLVKDVFYTNSVTGTLTARPEM
ncbi:MAG: hypothetical protein IKM94_00510, partial [Alphaproteobacteria bacterium]|nr:hypothetical protein [Alphaproteobacteria bacterium]